MSAGHPVDCAVVLERLHEVHFRLPESEAPGGGCACRIQTGSARAHASLAPMVVTVSVRYSSRGRASFGSKTLPSAPARDLRR
eukprot:6512155-Pyramimonas_sp.AAC.2